MSVHPAIAPLKKLEKVYTDVYTFKMRLQLEWDENKNTANIKSHDIDFCDAWKIFEHPMLRKIDTRKDYGEERWAALGKLDQTIIVIVYTHRSEKIEAAES